MLKWIARYILRKELAQWSAYADHLEHENEKLRSQSLKEIETQLAIMRYLENVD